MNGRGNSIWERAPRGGADAWDFGLGGQVVTEDFFGAAPPPAGLQAVRFDANADVLTMPSAALPAGSGGWTVAGWFRLVADRNAVTTLWSLDGVFSSSWHSLRTTADGTSLRLNESGTDVLTIASLTVGTWYFLAVRKDAAGNVKAYVGTEAGGALSTVTGTVTNIATYSGDGYVGGNAYGDWFDGRAWGLRLWDAALTDGEVDAEFAAATAARTSNLRAQWLLDAVPPLDDTSGNNRDLTNSGGSWALEAGPTLPAAGPATVAPTAVGVLTGTQAVTLGISGTVTPTPVGVLTGTQAVTPAVSVAPATTGVLTGAQSPTLATSLAVAPVGVVTGQNAPVLATPVAVAASGVLTGSQTPSLSAAGSVSPAAVGVATGTNAPALSASVPVGATGVLTGSQTPSLAASVAVGATGVLTGLQTPSASARLTVASTGVLTGTQAPAVGVAVSANSAGVLTGAQSVALAAAVGVPAVGVLTGLQAVVSGVSVAPAPTGVLTGTYSLQQELPDVWATPSTSRTRARSVSSGASRAVASSGGAGATSVDGSSRATTTGDASSSARTT